MTSGLASADLDDLRAEGLRPTDDDIVRLHALALRISDGQETTAYNAPRWATAGGVIFWEPTMAARYWFSYAKQFAHDEATEEVMFAFACANGRRRGFLSGLIDRDAIERELGAWLATVTATADEISRAVAYAALGHEQEAERTEFDKRKDAVTDAEKRNYSALEEILANAAAATGLTFDDIMVQTPSRLRGMIYAAHVQAGMEMSKTSARAHAEYLATLDAIAKRLRKEREAEK